MPIAVEVRVPKPSVLEIRFKDGVRTAVDLGDLAWVRVFESLRDPELFRQAFVDPEAGTVAWPNGADVAPEFRYGDPGDYPHQAKVTRHA